MTAWIWVSVVEVGLLTAAYFDKKGRAGLLVCAFAYAGLVLSFWAARTGAQ